MNFLRKLFSRRGPVRKALLVGVGNYPGAGSDLRGPINDVADLYNLLTEQAGYSVRTVQDRRAHPKRVLSELSRLIRGSRAGDSLFFAFSGHGTSIRDISGDESDARDEALCGYGSPWGASLILDDELGKILKTVPKGVKMLVLADCCHSGTITRELHSLRGIQQRRVRYLPAPRADGGNVTALQPRARMLLPDAKMTHVLLSGCEPYEYSYETSIRGTVRGVLTYYFCDIMRKNPDLTHIELHERIKQAIKRTDLQQNPRLEGQITAKSRKVFE